MGSIPLNSKKSNSLAIIGLGASVLAFAFLIWGIADLEFKRGGVKAIYIIAFVFIILCMLIFISLLIFFDMRKNESHRTFNNVGRTLCILIIGMCSVAFIFILVSFIVLLVDYVKLRSRLKDLNDYLGDMRVSFFSGNNMEERIANVISSIKEEEDFYEMVWGFQLDNVLTKGKIAGHEWGAVIVPSIISLISLVVMALVGNVLYKVFKGNVNSNPYPTPVNITQNLDSTYPNVSQPGIFQNNNGNNITNPVIVQQSQTDLNK